MMLVAPIASRNEFGQLLNSLSLTGLAVEVGTHRGEFARIFLSSWAGFCLYCIDPWSVPPGYEKQAKYLAGGGRDRENDLREAELATAIYGARVKLIRQTSGKAVRDFWDGSLDFCYLDGDHSRRAVEDDIRMWWGKLKSRGIMAGHDFLCPGPKSEDNWGREIQPAVLEFADAKGLDVHLVPEPDGHPWSWMIHRP